MIEARTLPNGVRLIFEPIEHIRSAAVGVWVANGSRYETPAENGMSHFIEHMLFKGTAARTAARIAEEMDALGGQFNAFTTRDCTSFYFRALDESLPRGIEILGDMLRNSLFREQDIELERGVICEELDMYEDTPDDMASERLLAACFAGSALGMPIIGTRETLAHMTGAGLKAYMQAHYVPANIVAAIAGRFTPADADRLCAVFAGLPAAPPPAHDRAEYQSAYTAREKPIEQNHLCLGFRGISYGDPARYAAQIFSNILGDGMSSRLFQKLREESGLCYSVYSFTAAHAETGVGGIYVGVSPEAQEKALTLLRQVTAELLEHGPTPAELDRARGQIKASVLMSLESTLSRMNHLARSTLLLGRVPTPEDIVAAYDAVDRRAALDAGMKVFDPATVSLSVVGSVVPDTLWDIVRA